MPIVWRIPPYPTILNQPHFLVKSPPKQHPPKILIGTDYPQNTPLLIPRYRQDHHDNDNLRHDPHAHCTYLLRTHPKPSGHHCPVLVGVRHQTYGANACFIWTCLKKYGVFSPWRTALKISMRFSWSNVCMHILQCLRRVPRTTGHQPALTMNLFRLRSVNNPAPIRIGIPTKCHQPVLLFLS